jgi:hypothetical protein
MSFVGFGLLLERRTGCSHLHRSCTSARRELPLSSIFSGHGGSAMAN